MQILPKMQTQPSLCLAYDFSLRPVLKGKAVSQAGPRPCLPVHSHLRPPRPPGARWFPPAGLPLTLRATCSFQRRVWLCFLLFLVCF